MRLMRSIPRRARIRGPHMDWAARSYRTHVQSAGGDQNAEYASQQAVNRVYFSHHSHPNKRSPQHVNACIDPWQVRQWEKL